MRHELDWFTAREGSYVLRGTTEVFISNDVVATKLFNLQEEGYLFDVKLNIHRAPVEECQSCHA